MDIEHIRERAEFLALEMLVVMLMQAIQASSPTAAQSLAKALHESDGKLAHVHPKNATAEEGDLLMGELQEAWQRLAKRVLAVP